MHRAPEEATDDRSAGLVSVADRIYDEHLTDL